MEYNRPKVEIGIIIIKDNKVLLGKRKNAHGEGDWAFPGGHLELNETWEDCVQKEIKEEVDIEVKNIRFGAVTNDIFTKESKHYITIFMLTDYASGEVKTMEPEKCEKWEWFEWDKLPNPRFIPLQNLLKQNFNPFNI